MQNVFVQSGQVVDIADPSLMSSPLDGNFYCICPNWKFYLSTLLNVFVKKQNVFVQSGQVVDIADPSLMSSPPC